MEAGLRWIYEHVSGPALRCSRTSAFQPRRAPRSVFRDWNVRRTRRAGSTRPLPRRRLWAPMRLGSPAHLLCSEDLGIRSTFVCTSPRSAAERPRRVAGGDGRPTTIIATTPIVAREQPQLCDRQVRPVPSAASYIYDASASEASPLARRPRAPVPFIVDNSSKIFRCGRSSTSSAPLRRRIPQGREVSIPFGDAHLHHLGASRTTWCPGVDEEHRHHANGANLDSYARPMRRKTAPPRRLGFQPSAMRVDRLHRRVSNGMASTCGRGDSGYRRGRRQCAASPSSSATSVRASRSSTPKISATTWRPVVEMTQFAAPRTAAQRAICACRSPRCAWSTAVRLAHQDLRSWPSAEHRRGDLEQIGGVLSHRVAHQRPVEQRPGGRRSTLVLSPEMSMIRRRRRRPGATCG